MTARCLAKGLLAAALMLLWAILIVSFNPHAQAICAAMPQLAVTLGLGFVGLAFLVGVAPGRSGRALQNPRAQGVPISEIPKSHG